MRSFLKEKLDEVKGAT